MRELKFRHYNLFTNEMHYSEKDFHCLEHYFSNREYDSSDEMQFIGLKDKNGIELYDRDIIQSLHFVDHLGVENYLRFVVQWSERLKGWVAIRSDGTEMQIWVYADSVRGEFEVIGNIYENPELLESK